VTSQGEIRMDIILFGLAGALFALSLLYTKFCNDI
jgi:hypothetical protein